MPSRVPNGETRGHIVPIGGAENKENDPKILARFVQASGGDDADIVVIPTASRAHETGGRYEKLFRELGARRVDVMDFDTRRDCAESNRLDRIARADGVFFTGGNQLRITTLIGGTPVAKQGRAGGFSARFIRTRGKRWPSRSRSCTIFARGASPCSRSRRILLIVSPYIWIGCSVNAESHRFN